jgi:sulfoxide reductase heme-binding subunit YedZ
MSVTFRAVGWNTQKRRYDLTLGTSLAAYLAVFCAIVLLRDPHVTVETLLIRAFGTAAFLLLHVILAIGPLCRLDRRFLPLLYNRRHLGVTMFLMALAHGTFALVQFHAFGDLHPLVSLLVSSTDYTSPARFPFQPLGALALTVLFMMAASSHDFWLRALTPPVWKRLHMCVYLAYAAVVLHVAFGALQSEVPPAMAVSVGLGMTLIVGLHVAAALRERRADRDRTAGPDEAFVDVCAVDEIPECRARIACLSGERIAIFRYDGLVSAISNVCQHQNGPLGEGRIVNGCVVCPWHGYEYLPATGSSPPPFTERVPTFRVRVRDGRVLVDPRPFPPGTPQEPARVSAA